VQFVTIHGHRRAYVKAGTGPAILLLHGIGMDHKSWLPVIERLSDRYTVIAPDLRGHGLSDKPRADYSIAGYANAMRDLLTVLGVGSVTVVGHSLGGGIAMQFAYQYPQMTQRLVLVAAGGLGRTVNPLIRFFTLPGSGIALRILGQDIVRYPLVEVMNAIGDTGLPMTQDLHTLAEVYDDLADPAAQSAFLHVLRAAVDWRGQIITSLDRAYLAEHMPSMVVWGERDLVIPVKHARAAAEVLPGSRLEIFPESGHNPHEDEPDMFAEVLSDFIDTVPRSTHHPGMWRKALLQGPRPRRARAKNGAGSPPRLQVVRSEDPDAAVHAES
jgi:pimeloyl-ACP methyl ester carboxylesterase